MPKDEASKPTLSLETLLLLQQCLRAQQLSVGDESFRDLAQATVKALDELDQAIEKAQAEG